MKFIIIILTLIILIAVLFLGFIYFNKSEYIPRENIKCKIDEDCKGYCGDNDCLQDVCYNRNGSDSGYCDCLGLCGVR